MKVFIVLAAAVSFCSATGGFQAVDFATHIQAPNHQFSMVQKTAVPAAQAVAIAPKMMIGRGFGADWDWSNTAHPFFGGRSIVHGSHLMSPFAKTAVALDGQTFTGAGAAIPVGLKADFIGARSLTATPIAAAHHNLMGIAAPHQFAIATPKAMTIAGTPLGFAAKQMAAIPVSSGQTTSSTYVSRVIHPPETRQIVMTGAPAATFAHQMPIATAATPIVSGHAFSAPVAVPAATTAVVGGPTPVVFAGKSLGQIEAEKFMADKFIADKMVADKMVADKIVADKMITEKAIAERAYLDSIISKKAFIDAQQARAMAADKWAMDAALINAPIIGGLHTGRSFLTGAAGFGGFGVAPAFMGKSMVADKVAAANAAAMMTGAGGVPMAITDKWMGKAVMTPSMAITGSVAPILPTAFTNDAWFAANKGMLLKK